MRYIVFLVGFSLSAMLNVGLAGAMTQSGGLTLEQISEAPWVFLGEVKSVETLTDGKTPLDFPQKWQARYTRFTVIHGIKGPLYKGDEIELKECADRDLPGQPFCGSLYPSAPIATIGERFFVVTGPGNPNVYDYQTSIRFSMMQVPKTHPLTFPRLPKLEMAEGSVLPDELMRESESGWMVDLSRLSKRRKVAPLEETAPVNGLSSIGSKARSFAMENQEDELSGGPADLNKLIDRLGGKPFKEE